METTPTLERPILNQISKKLMQAHQEIDELAVQLALGKAEATDKFEEIKKEFKKHITELKKLSESPDVLNTTNIGKLEIQLDLGKVNGADTFEIQKEKILSALAAAGKQLTSSEFFQHEAEKFKLKLTILQLAFALKRLQIKDGFRQRMEDAKKTIETLSDRIRVKVRERKGRYGDFKEEIQSAYSHMKKAIEKL